MKLRKTLIALVAGAAVLAAGSSAYAISMTWTDVNTYQNLLLSSDGVPRTTKTDFWDITSDGFVPGTDIATAAEATFTLTDNDPNAETVRIRVPYNVGYLVANGAFESTFTFGLSSITVLADINADGILYYRVRAMSGDFYFNSASLTVNGERPSPNDPTGVPDGGASVALLGMGLLGLGTLKRKLA